MMHERRGILSKMFHGVWQTVDASRKIAVNLLFVAIVIVLLAVAATGAYTEAMASNYNRLPRPGAVIVGDRGTRWLVRRETLPRYSRYFIVVIFILSAILTPPDIISQVGIAIPLILLYFITFRAGSPKPSASMTRTTLS